MGSKGSDNDFKYPGDIAEANLSAEEEGRVKGKGAEQGEPLQQDITEMRETPLPETDKIKRSL